MPNDGEWVEIDPKDLNGWVEFDSPFEVDGEGNVRQKWELYVPSYFDDEIDGSGWETWSQGYTGQYSYQGPVMHNSEYLGGRMASDLLAEPGVYVLTPAHWRPTIEDEADPDFNIDNYDDIEGWVVLKKKEA
jgi:hypothetical protein